MKHAILTMPVLLLVAALFVYGAGDASTKLAQPGPHPVLEEEARPEGDDDGGDKKDEESFAPRGPDELFTPLPADGLYEGAVPERAAKAVILQVPNEDSWNLRPEDDLDRHARTSVGGFVLILEHHLDYLPQVYVETHRVRVHRYAARLRKGDAPRAGSEVAVGMTSQSLEDAARAFGAEIVFAISAVPGEDAMPARAGCARYRAGDGIEKFVEWEIGKPEGDSQSGMLEAHVRDVTAGILATEGEDGELIEVPHAPVPRLVTSDRALEDFVKLRDALESGRLTNALIAYETLMERDPRCGRAALYGMEVCRGIAERQSTSDEHARWMNRSIEIGREALKHSPNDVMLRGRLCWNATTHFNRREWAQRGLTQAMVVQPGSTVLFDWWVLAYAFDDKEKQAAWMIENALPKVRDGRVELSLGNIYYGAGKYEEGVKWYTRATEKMPNDHESFLSLGLCANYEAERQVKQNATAAARDVFATAAEALWRAIEIDPQETGWAYEYYVRTKTRKFTYLPSDPQDLQKLFLVQAVVNGLSSNSRTFQWDRLTGDIDRFMQRSTRKLVSQAERGDENYAVKLMARFKLAIVDGDDEEMIRTLWLMREDGWRPEMYVEAMARLGPLVDEYQPEPEGTGEAESAPAD